MIDEVMFEIREMTGQEYRNHYAGEKVDTSDDQVAVAQPAFVTDPIERAQIDGAGTGRRRALAAAVLGRALLQERRDAFAVVVGLEQPGEVGRHPRPDVVPVGVERPAQSLLQRLHGERGVGGDASRQLGRRR